MTFGAASARPQLDTRRELANDGLELAFARLVGRGRRQAEHQHLGARGLDTVDDFARGQIGAEIGNAQSRARRQHRRAERRDLVALASGRRKQQADRRLAAGVQPEKRAEQVPHRGRHQVLVRDARPPAVPVVADFCEHRHQHVLEEVERTQDCGQTGELLVDADGVVLAQRGEERRRIERCPPRRIDSGRRDAAGRGAEVAQLIVAERGEPADAVSLFYGAVEEPEACDVDFRVHPAAIVTGRRDGAVAALPRAQRVDADPGQPGRRADGVACGRLMSFAHRATLRTATAHAAEATAPHATSVSASASGH